jgi:Pentapeptide repeats (8 copies)
VQAAWISAGAALIGVGGTAAVAIFGLRHSSASNRAAIESAAANLRQTLETEREAQITDRYSRAAEQLGSDKIDVRIAGIYALERIARDSARDHPTAVEVLTAFIRDHSREQWPPPEDRQTRNRSTRPDVQAAATVIARRLAERDVQPCDLTGASLPGANLTGAQLDNAFLVQADLSTANLSAAKLRDAFLMRADISMAWLNNADLSGADLTEADLTGADLTGAELSGARWPRVPDVPPGWLREEASGTLKRG